MHKLNEARQKLGRDDSARNPALPKIGNTAPEFAPINRAKLAAWLARNYQRRPGGDQPDYFDDLRERYTGAVVVRGGRV